MSCMLWWFSSLSSYMGYENILEIGKTTSVIQLDFCFSIFTYVSSQKIKFNIAGNILVKPSKPKCEIWETGFSLSCS